MRRGGIACQPGRCGAALGTKRIDGTVGGNADAGLQAVFETDPADGAFGRYADWVPTERCRPPGAPTYQSDRPIVRLKGFDSGVPLRGYASHAMPNTEAMTEMAATTKKITNMFIT